MKARVMQQASPRVLTYGMDIADRRRLSDVLKRLSLTEYPIQPNQIGQTVGYLAGLPGFSEVKTDHIPSLECPGILCMCGLSNQQVDQLLAALREAAISIPLKAVLTPTNQKWHFYKLMEELKKERTAFAQQKNKLKS